METIKNYLEAMFAGMPSTPEVWKAKNELYQMMEDKYNELIEEGKTDNEAVGRVISEFGNLQELADDLGIGTTVMQAVEAKPNRRMILQEEVKKYLEDYRRHSLFISMGVLLCILSVIVPIWTDTFSLPDVFGFIGMFVFIAAAVGFFVYSGNLVARWNFIRKESCAVDYSTWKFLETELDRNRGRYAVMTTIGIVLCVISWMPAAIIDEWDEILGYGAMQNMWISQDFSDSLSGSMLFILVAIGVYLIVYSSNQKGSYEKILKLNDTNIMGGTYGSRGREPQKEYISPAAATIMDLYWPTIACFYLIWSFLTFDWWCTWIIWPVAGIVSWIMESILKK